MMRERDIKRRLYDDYLGKPKGPELQEALEKATNNAELWSAQRYSRRVGLHVPDSPQALAQTRADWMEQAKEENLGAPTAMTTVVIHAKTSTIRAHVERGPLALPDPEDTVAHLSSNPKPFNLLRHVFVQI